MPRLKLEAPDGHRDDCGIFRGCIKTRIMNRPLLKAILADSHFWVPVVVLAAGIALLVVIR
jgi:hypothetical protein